MLDKVAIAAKVNEAVDQYCETVEDAMEAAPPAVIGGLTAKVTRQLAALRGLGKKLSPEDEGFERIIDGLVISIDAICDKLHQNQDFYDGLNDDQQRIIRGDNRSLTKR